jgi:steroid delta-isomerase-like uncharacterized protein
MTEPETHALIRAYYDAFNRQDWDGMLVLLSDRVEHDLNQGARELGRDAFARFLQRMARCYREQLHDVRILAGPAHAAAEYVVVGEYLHADEGLPAARGQRYRLPGGAFFDVRDGQIRRVSNYYNLNDWLRQVGA